MKKYITISIFIVALFSTNIHAQKENNISEDQILESLGMIEGKEKREYKKKIPEFKVLFENLGIKDKLNEIDYQKNHLHQC